MFCKVSVFFLREFAESRLDIRCASDGLCEAGAAWTMMYWHLDNDVLAFGAILNVPVCVQIMLSYIESADC